MKAARSVEVPDRVAGVACRLWQREATASVERFWLGEEDGVPRRFERSAPDGTLLARLDWLDVSVGNDLPDASFSVPAGTLGLPEMPPGI
jgi:outer membrane lipoprotein-sorting protein